MLISKHNTEILSGSVFAGVDNAMDYDSAVN